MKRMLFGGGLILILPLLAACSSEPVSPEGQVRAVIEQAEEAAEARDLTALREYISEDYQDKRGQTKQSVLQVMQFYFMSHRSIYLLTQVQELTFPESGRAEVGVLVGMAGRPGEGVLDWSFFRADIYRFDVVLADEGGDWKVVEATWRKASIDEAE